MSRRWSIWVDTGGTFTDCLGIDPAGRLRRCKVLSSSRIHAVVARVADPRRCDLAADAGLPAGLLRGCRLRCGQQEATILDHASGGRELVLDADLPLAPGVAVSAISAEQPPVLGARILTGTAGEDALPPIDLRLATTRGTNALLERRGADCALVVSAGFGDLLAIGDQTRDELFARAVRRRAPVAAATLELPGRINAAGRELEPLDLDHLRRAAGTLRARGIRSVALALMHAWTCGEHERRAAEVLRELGFERVVCSHLLAPHIGLLARAETAVVEAYLAPILDAYLDGVARHLKHGRIEVLTSAGGLVERAAFRATDSLLSGPAGGVAGAATAARAAGCERIIAFDMGGTSTDVSRWAGDFDYRFEHAVGDARLLAPALAIHTVAAGGGSVCHLAAGTLQVGPHSAGADPGPACYGAGGPLTVTDCNLLLGRLDPERFPFVLDTAAAQARLAEVLAELGDEDPAAVLEGFLAIANQRMADAIRSVSLARGADPAAHALVAFGGAGPQNACAVAAELDIREVLIPADAGLLSARGLGGAERERFASRQVLAPLAEVELDRLWRELESQARDDLAASVPRERIRIRRRIAALRLSGQDATLDLDLAPDDDPAVRFAETYRATFGHAPEQRPIELVSLRVVAAEAAEPPPLATPRDRGDTSGQSVGSAVFAGRTHELIAYQRDRLGCDAAIDGPALVSEAHSVTVVPPGWRLGVDPSGALRLRHLVLTERRSHPEAVRRTLFANRLSGIAEAMGAQLGHTAISTNVKERRDFSCGILDPQGRLVVNAPHIPVHLGALGRCVRAVVAALPLGPGDVAVTNHPAFGGSHLPDVTLITPVHDQHGALLGYCASRAHHADVGGTRPGSMPPDARSLAEEGAVIAPRLLVAGGEGRWDELEGLLAAPPYPSRRIADNLADLRAALAANQRGVEALRTLALEHGADALDRAMDSVRSYASERAVAALRALGPRQRVSEQRLDDGAPIRVAIDPAATPPVIDFAGTGPVHPGNYNATPAIVTAGCLYALRLLIDDEVPLNEGLLDGIELRIPTGSMLAPVFDPDPACCPPVVGGNTELSQRVVDALLDAFDIAACSQGTMNNLLFGDARFGYYETLAGGTGATAGAAGCDTVHCHMTNTRITDPEILELRYPVRLERHAIRRGSGGTGLHRGGDGLVRHLRFTAPVSVSLLTQRRTSGPAGAHGGGDGSPGRQWIERADGSREDLPGTASAELAAGDLLAMETPGGGAWGSRA